ncbi:uncharacterized protein LOC133907156 [Phragmites australis]|uniref:uncharacterized protein LOC133907156 n=1 Tax=Phragmites australis TaxID=29695 RepID=UPI002D77DE15|nr:uncharacterized protein LOC133907156 [Phragmites australis]
MPKDRSSRVASFESRRRSRGSPYFSSSRGRSASRLSEESSAAAAAAAAKQAAEWEEVRCPVCMDHPHNAVLLVCSSHEMGCRPFMCDTSSRHSNCLDQYCKSSKESSKDPGAAAAAAAAAAECSECQQQVKLSCPLCRGPVSHWIKDNDARRFMNSKIRSCTTDSCEFRGAYHELRKHARVEHPAARPMVVDPERQRDWRRMEQQRDFGDLLSMLRSGFSSGVEDDGGLGNGEGEEEITETALHSRSFTMVVIMRSTRSINQYLSGRRTIFLIREGLGEPSPAAGTSGSDDANAAAPDGEAGDGPAPSTEASTGSAHDCEELADGDPAQ